MFMRNNGIQNQWKKYSTDLYCIDRNCINAPTNSNQCNKCSTDYYLSNNLCLICPQGAVCDGFIFMCPDGRYNNGSKCAYCHASCRTCSGGKDDNCTSCNSYSYLLNGKCTSCPDNAVCNGSSYFSCKDGYSRVDGTCVKEENSPVKTNTVSSCPARMTMSADGCCCVNK